MRTPSINKSYADLADNDMEVKCSHISERLDDNPDFPGVVEELALFNGFRNTFSLALGKASTGDKASIAFKNHAKDSLAEYMRTLAIKIESVCKGDKSKLISSGFDLAADGETPSVIGAPENFKLTEGPGPGQVISTVKGNKRKVAYSHEYCLYQPDANAVWIAKPSSSREYTFSGLPSGTRVYFRVAVVGTKGQVSYTAVISRVVQ